MSSTSIQPAGSGSSTTVSSKRTRPRAPTPLIGAQGSTCFWPESAIAANQIPRFCRRRKARIAGFWPLLAFA